MNIHVVQQVLYLCMKANRSPHGHFVSDFPEYACVACDKLIIVND